MPIKQAAFKSVRQTEKHRARNLIVKTNLKRTVKAVRKAVAGRDAGKAKETLKTTIPVIDRAAQKGVIKRNTAARLKSRLQKAVAKI